MAPEWSIKGNDESGNPHDSVHKYPWNTLLTVTGMRGLGGGSRTERRDSAAHGSLEASFVEVVEHALHATRDGRREVWRGLRQLPVAHSLRCDR